MTPPANATVEPSQCPLCHQPNECQICTAAAYKGPCWCAQVEIPDALLAQIPPDQHNQVCLCQNCITTWHRTHPRPPKIQPGDFYFEHGLMVFTAAHHLRRGYCCSSGCRHCPYS